VTFDVGGTLIECWPSVGHIYAEVAARHTGRSLAPAVLNRRFAAAWRAQRNFEHSRSDWSALVDATFDGLLEVSPSQTFFPELYDRFSEPKAWHVFDDVLETLATLSARGLKLGIISNWDERLRPLLRALKLAPYFLVTLVSCEIGASKPAAAIFAAAARQLGLPLEKILHVGDSLEHDFRGAQAAGCHALWLDRAAPAAPGRISSLREIKAVISHNYL
jgi:putative hydrolase of the HAD superfamily